MPDQCRIGPIVESAKAEQPGIVAEGSGHGRLVEGLAGIAHDTGDADEAARLLPASDHIRGKRKDRTVEVDSTSPNRELCRVYTDRHACRPSVTIVSSQRQLAALVELAGPGQRQGMGWNHTTFEQRSANLGYAV